jgi:hypothetical protein
MISPKRLAGLQAKSRKRVAPAPPVVEQRDRLIALIDDFWRYYCSPSDYSFIDRRIDPETGVVSEIFVPGRWHQDHHIVRMQDGQVILSIAWEGRLLPLTKRGDEELVLSISTREVIEEILAEIKHSVKIGQMDSFLFRERMESLSPPTSTSAID